MKITRLDFFQVAGRTRIELLDLLMQGSNDGIVIVTSLFQIHLPVPEQVLSRKTARLTLVFRLEGEDWKIVHSGISVPYLKVGDDEVYLLKGLRESNRELESLVEERTQALEEANTKLEILRNTDWLPAIANRRNFDRALAKEWNRAPRFDPPVAPILPEVDLFKHFQRPIRPPGRRRLPEQDSQALTQAAQRAGDLIARYGGEEFAVLLPNTSEENALHVAQRALNDVRSLAIPHAQTALGIVTVSPPKQHAPEDLVRQADSALYQAKHAGRNCVKSTTDSPPAAPGGRHPDT